MARLIFFVCLVVALSSVTFAAPLAEEKVNAQQIIEDIDNLLSSADPEENDIAPLVEATDSTAEALTTPSPVKDDVDVVEADKEQVQAITEEEIAAQVTPTSASLADVSVPSDEPTAEEEFEETVEELIKNYGETEEKAPEESDKQEETVEKVTELPSNTTKQTDVKTTIEQDGQLVPVTEIIPPPKKAFVLGEYADDQEVTEPASENNDEYQIVLGETEEGIPFLSEYQPDALAYNHEEMNADAPLVEEPNYEYPEEPIMPGAEYRPFQGPMIDHSEVMYDDYNPGARFGPDTDYNPDYEGHNVDYHQSDDYTTSMNPDMSDYPTESHFDGRLDYADDYSLMPSDNSHDYDTGASPTEDDQVMHEEMPSDDQMMHDDTPSDGQMMHDDTPSDGQMMHDDMPSSMPIHDDLKASMATTFSNVHGAIVAGLHENYHPEPIPGMIPFQTQSSEVNQDTFSSSDAQITPSAMVNFDSPAVENTRHQDDMMETPMPDIPSMVDLPRPVAEFPVNNQPMASMLPVDVDSMSFMNDNDMEDNEGTPSDNDYAELSERPTQTTDEDESSTNDLGTDSQPDVVIELDIKNQQALVNGKPFTMKRPTSILGFIGQILESTTMPSRNPPSSDYSPERKPFYYYYDSGMNYPERNQYASSYMYPSSYDDDTESEQYQPSSFGYDYLPYNSFISALRRRLLQARYNKMRSFDNGYDYTPMQGYNSISGYDDSMQSYNSIRGYDDSMQGYNPMQGYNSYRGYDDSMQGYNPRQGYGAEYYQYW